MYPQCSSTGFYAALDKQFWDDFRRSTQHSDVWLRWEYSPEEWALYDRVDYRPRRRVLLSLLCGLLAGLPFSIPLAFSVNGWEFAGLPFVGIGSLIALLIWGISRIGPGRRRKARQQPGQPHRVTFAAQAIWIAGTHVSLLGLAKVKLTGQPPVLSFSIQETDTDGSVSFSGLRVLVPRGHEAEAERLRQLYQTEAIDGARQAQERLYHPPEPR